MCADQAENLIPPSDPPALPFLDVAALLDLSEPQPRAPWLWFSVGTLAFFLLLGVFASQQPAEVRGSVDLFALVLLGGLMVTAGVTARRTARRHRGAFARLAEIEELMQLRHWEQAALMLQDQLSRPAVNHQHRLQALVYLAAILSRYQRFEDAIAVQSYLLETHMLDDASGYGLRLGRGLAMLREDHLLDADRAISDLRRRGGEEQSVGLMLVEMYRDVKTGHPDEALELYSKQLEMARRQMGHRVADVHALAAGAYLLKGNAAQAKAAYERATLLAPAGELTRRYPELTKLLAGLVPAVAPLEAA